MAPGSAFLYLVPVPTRPAPGRAAAEFAKGQILRLLTGQVDMIELAMSGCGRAGRQ